MEPNANYSVVVQSSSPRAIAAVRARVPVGQVPAVFAAYLNQVYALGRSGAIQLDGQNIFVYRDAGNKELDVDFGVGVKVAFAPIGAVEYSRLPIGAVATTTHWGDYARLGDAHRAVTEWCRSNNRALSGTSWEIYGHWTGDMAAARTDIFYLLKPPV